MKVDQVPQDLDQGYEGIYKIRYARDKDGNIIKVKSTGWSVEEAATGCAWEDINESLIDTLKKVKGGKLSPLAYHMEEALLTPQLLAQNLGIWTWTVKRHLKPQIFKNLSDKKKQIYADYFEISLNDLLQTPSLYDE